MRRAPLIMGILNVTPDSFSDGGKFLSKDRALRWGEQMIKDGADILDVGGESTRPGAAPVSLQQEQDRVLPVLESLGKSFDTLLSVDTQKFEVAREAVRLGANIINDVSGGRDIRMGSLAARQKVNVILMHMHQNPATMQKDPCYPKGVVREVREFLRWRVSVFEELGVRREQIWVDPGIGFGKTVEHNFELLSELDRLQGLGHRVVIGTSRKSFIAKALGDAKLPMEARFGGTLATNLFALQKGASVFRVHDVGEFKRSLAIWERLNDRK